MDGEADLLDCPALLFALQKHSLFLLSAQCEVAACSFGGFGACSVLLLRRFFLIFGLNFLPLNFVLLLLMTILTTVKLLFPLWPLYLLDQWAVVMVPIPLPHVSSLAELHIFSSFNLSPKSPSQLFDHSL